MQADVKPGETLEGYEWPTRQQMDVLGELAAEHPSVKVERVAGTNDARLTWERTPYSQAVKVVDEFGSDVTLAALRPAHASIQVSIDVLVSILGQAHVESAIRTAVQRSPGYPSIELGSELRDEFIRAIQSRRSL